jgi:hypothetical protein
MPLVAGQSPGASLLRVQQAGQPTWLALSWLLQRVSHAPIVCFLRLFSSRNAALIAAAG